MNCDGGAMSRGREVGSENRKWKARGSEADIHFVQPYSLQVHLTTQCPHIPRIGERHENGEGEIGLSHFAQSEEGRARPFDVNLKPRHKHVSRVGGEADRGWKGRKEGRMARACDAESDFGS